MKRAVYRSGQFIYIAGLSRHLCPDVESELKVSNSARESAARRRMEALMAASGFRGALFT
jgi:hypothetical protein